MLQYSCSFHGYILISDLTFIKILSMKELNNKVAIIVGGTSGIEKAISEQLLEKGV
ncbi:MAG: hypothetical protein ACI94Y_003813 [Maribacter sp.]|jgi:hypothetical protein